MSAFSVVARAPVAARVASVNTTSTSSVRRSAVVVRAAPTPTNLAPDADGEVMYTDASGAAVKASAAQYAADKAAGNTYKTTLPAPVAATVSYSPAEVFAFQAPKGTNFLASGPELMNGRLAMLAFVAAAGEEMVNGKTVVEQAASSPVGVTLVISSVIAGSLWTYCANLKPPAAGPFKNNIELLNGRTAMIGFASLLAAEAFIGHALL